MRDRLLFVLLLLAFLTPLGGRVYGQTVEQIRNWIDQEASAAYDRIYPFPDFDGRGMAWSMATYVEGAALNALAARVAEYPDHPERTLLEHSQRRAEGLPYGSSYRLWTDGENRWRLSHDFYAGGEMMYWDVATMPTRQWWLTRDDLTLFAPGKIPHRAANVQQKANSIRGHLALLLTMRMEKIEQLDMNVGNVRVLPGSRFAFDAILPGPPEYILGYEGQWKDGRGFITRVVVRTNAQYEPDEGKAYVASDWHQGEGIGWIAAKVRVLEPSGELEYELVFNEVLDGEVASLDQLTQTPQADAKDPIRGSLTFIRLTDYRDAPAIDPLAVDVAGGGTPPGGVVPLRLIGWILLAASVLAGVGLFIVRRSRT